MKIEERETVMKQTLYICETCGQSHGLRALAEDCEKTHRQPTCSHRWEYEVTSGYQYEDDPYANLSRACVACLLEEELELMGLKSPQLEQVWAAIEKSKEGI